MLQLNESIVWIVRDCSTNKLQVYASKKVAFAAVELSFSKVPRPGIEIDENDARQILVVENDSLLMTITPYPVYSHGEHL